MDAVDNSFFYPGGRHGVLLIHGLGGTPTEMKYLGKGLARAGFTVSGMQLAGHCGSEADLLRTGRRDWYESVETAYDWLRPRVDAVFVGGLSMGALLAMELATRRPTACAGLALYSTTLWYDGRSIPRIHFLVPLILKLPFVDRFRFTEAYPFGIKDDRLRSRVVSQMHGGDSGAAGLPGLTATSLRELTKLIAQVKRDVAKVRVPTLVIHAIDDDVTSPRNALFLARNLGGPVRTVLLSDCYHMITVDRQRDEVVRLSADYFTEAATTAGISASIAAE